MLYNAMTDESKKSYRNFIYFSGNNNFLLLGPAGIDAL
jgi:hypothetical protein